MKVTAVAISMGALFVLLACGSERSERSGRSADEIGQGKTTPAEIASLCADLAAKSAEARSIAAYELGRHGPDALPATDKLVKLLQDPAGTVRVTAALAMYQITGDMESPMETLADVLARGTPALRVDAAHAIADIGQVSPRALQLLLKIVNGEDSEAQPKIYYDEGPVHVDPIPIGWTEASASAYALGFVATARPEVLAALSRLRDRGLESEREQAAGALDRIVAREED